MTDVQFMVLVGSNLLFYALLAAMIRLSTDYLGMMIKEEIGRRSEGEGDHIRKDLSQ